MPRTKQIRKRTINSTVASDTATSNRMSRILAIASNDYSVVESVTCSTPKKDKKKNFIKNFIKEVEADYKSFEQMFLNDIEEFGEEMTMFKLSVDAKILSQPLKAFKLYREKIAFEPINDEDLKGVSDVSDENCVPDCEESSDKFKKPDGNTTTLIQTTKRRTTRAAALKTPNNPIPFTPITTITPKVNMNQPVSVLRRPRTGEQAVSMSGSPIMVSSVPREDIATVSVPLHDGRVVTILPSSEFQPEQMPPLDNETKQQLGALYKNLAVFFEEGLEL